MNNYHYKIKIRKIFVCTIRLVISVKSIILKFGNALRTKKCP